MNTPVLNKEISYLFKISATAALVPIYEHSIWIAVIAGGLAVWWTIEESKKPSN